MPLRPLVDALRSPSRAGARLADVVQALPEVVGHDRPVAVVGLTGGRTARCAAEHGLPRADGWQVAIEALPGIATLRDRRTWVRNAEQTGSAEHGSVHGWPEGWPEPVAGVPLSPDGTLGGVLYAFGDPDVGPSERAVLEACGGYLTLALERDHRERDLTRSDRHLAQILTITAEIGRQHDFEAIAQHIVDGLTTATDFRVATITLREDDTCRRLAAAGIADPRVGLTTPYASWADLLQGRWRRGLISYLIPPEAEALWSEVPDIPPSDDPDAWTADHALVLTLLDPDDEIVGFLSVDQPRSGRLPDGRTIEGLELFARQVQVALVNARLYAELRLAAERDSLTGLPNRRALWTDLEDLLAAVAPGAPLSLAVVDVDDFKLVNDAHGHAVGDRTLQHVADRLARACRETDRVYRIGGEEFVVVLPETTASAAGIVLERATAAMRERRAGVPTVTLSCGVADVHVAGGSPDGLFAAADAALYRAKRAGKDAVAIAEG